MGVIFSHVNTLNSCHVTLYRFTTTLDDIIAVASGLGHLSRQALHSSGLMCSYHFLKTSATKIGKWSDPIFDKRSIFFN